MEAKQYTLDLYADKPLLKPEEFLTYSAPRKLKLPPRPGERKRIFFHWAFDRIHLYPPPRRRVRPEFQPELINAELFEVDSIRPFPEWPLICKLIGLPAFETEKDRSKFMEFNHSPVLLKWRCRACKMIHAWTSYPGATDTGGNWKAGSDVPPSRILLEFMHPANERLFRFIRQ